MCNETKCVEIQQQQHTKKKKQEREKRKRAPIYRIYSPEKEKVK